MSSSFSPCPLRQCLLSIEMHFPQLFPFLLVAVHWLSFPSVLPCVGPWADLTGMRSPLCSPVYWFVINYSHLQNSQHHGFLPCPSPMLFSSPDIFPWKQPQLSRTPSPISNFQLFQQLHPNNSAYMRTSSSFIPYLQKPAQIWGKSAFCVNSENFLICTYIYTF